MHEKLFESQEEWSGQTTAVETFKELAARLELDQGQFDACLDEGAHADRVASDLREGEGLGVTGTPNFRINGLELSGAQPFTAFQQQIEYFLAGGEAPSAEVGADSFRSLGEPDAPVVVTEYADFQ